MTVKISRRLFAWLIVMCSVAPLAVALGGVWYTSHSIDQNNRKLCAVLEISDQPQSVTTPIQDPAARARIEQGRRLIHKLRVDYRCISR